MRKERSDLGGYATDKFRCNKCPNCRKTRSEGWAFRLLQEQKKSVSSAFVTLTYNEEEVPQTENGLLSLSKKDLQDFHKRLRKQMGSWFGKDRFNEHPIRYYAVGEYGGKTERPHYHGIYYNIPKVVLEDPLVLEAIWKKGRIQIDKAEPGSMRYVTNYINKSITEHGEDERAREFSLMSKGLGKGYLTEAIIDYYASSKTPYILKEGGSKQAMPRYYKDKIFQGLTEVEKREMRKQMDEYIVLASTENKRHMGSQDGWNWTDTSRRLNIIDKSNREKLHKRRAI